GDFDDGPGGSSLGRRRPMRAFVKNPDVCGGVDEHGPYVRLAFELPRGAFATTVLREIMKVDAWEAYRGGA
ncbi:MAG: tRNA pseudouridine(13) synthase TruD, partial [Phycisphaeraceae bacterium]